MDEVQTGGGPSGTFWAHEQWGLEQSPDMVTFAKKLQTGGYFFSPHLRPKEAYRIYNTWMGDPHKMIMLKAYIDTVQEDHLLQNVGLTGEYLRTGLAELQNRHPGVLSNLRGSGTFLAIDVKDGASANALVGEMQRRGVESGVCGTRSIRFRPALIFTPTHAAMALNVLEDSLTSLFH